MPKISFTIKDSQEFVNQKHMPPVPTRKDLKPINNDIEQTNDNSVDDLVVILFDGPLHNQGKH